jgi:aminoglycoside 6'-N-acetyltransferase I
MALRAATQAALKSVIRPAKESDSADWERMREALWPSEPGEHAREIARYFAGGAREPLEVLLAFDERGEAIGLIELSIRSYAEGATTDRVAFIEGWYVDEPARRRGLGATLVGAAEDWARSQGCLELGSDTEVDNVESAAAHRALGFTETGVIRCFLKRLE